MLSEKITLSDMLSYVRQIVRGLDPEEEELQENEKILYSSIGALKNRIDEFSSLKGEVDLGYKTLLKMRSCEYDTDIISAQFLKYIEDVQEKLEEVMRLIAEAKTKFAETIGTEDLKEMLTKAEANVKESQKKVSEKSSVIEPLMIELEKLRKEEEATHIASLAVATCDNMEKIIPAVLTHKEAENKLWECERKEQYAIEDFVDADKEAKEADEIVNYIRSLIEQQN